jgi:hypothetical protein
VVQRRKLTQADSPLQRAQLIIYFNHPAPHSEMTRPRGTVNGRRKNRDGQRMADADLEKTCREERDTHSRQRTPELSSFPNTLLFPILYTLPFFLPHAPPHFSSLQNQTPHLPPSISLHAAVQTACERNSNSSGGRGGCSSATGFGRREQGEDRVRRIDRDTVGRNTDEALDGLAIWTVYWDADRTLRLSLRICRV